VSEFSALFYNINNPWEKYISDKRLPSGISHKECVGMGHCISDYCHFLSNVLARIENKRKALDYFRALGRWLIKILLMYYSDVLAPSRSAGALWSQKISEMSGRVGYAEEIPDHILLSMTIRKSLVQSKKDN
jgi:hypothetical protein